MKDTEDFYQRKYNYYKKVNTWTVIIAAISSAFYYFTDVYIIGHFSVDTLPARTAIFIPLLIFILIERKYDNYRVMVAASYLIVHCIMWCTIWACASLPDLSYASDGFMIINVICLAVSMAAPIKWAIIGHGILYLDIFLANFFLNYPDFWMMFMLGGFCFIGISFCSYFFEVSFQKQDETSRKLEKSAHYDQLTGIYNRNYMLKVLTEEGTFVKRGEDLSVILFDIDSFKQVNDTYGHESGDIVLKHVVNVVADHLGQEDSMIRWGGEEFLILLPIGRDEAIKKAEEIRMAVATTPSNVCELTISLGVTEYEGGDYNGCIKRVDKALYRAKNLGKNRVEVL